MQSPTRSAAKTSACRRPPRRCGRRSRNAIRAARRRSDGAEPMYNFTYHRASGLRQAQNLMGKLEDPKLLAGGMTLLPTVQLAIPALAAVAHMIGDPAVRHRGTLGGSVANNDPNADYPAACLGLGATIVTTKRKIVADDFFKALFETALAEDEIITKVSFPIPKKAAYQKFKNQASRFALVGVFVAKRPSEIRLAVTGAGASGVFRVPDFEAALKKRFSPKSLEGLSIPADGLAGDIHGSAEYRAHLVGVLARRAVADAG